MENKKTFGAYILRRRKELGMTQREFAEKLFVTESAVSKWERGLSYPDITLLTTICDILDISEHELLTGSEDTQKRTSEKLAARYLRLIHNYRLAQYIIYGLILACCAIGNLATGHTLDWFFIVLPSVLMAASLTLVPSLISDCPRLNQCRAAISLGCFTISLELLLLTSCIYSGGDWFLMAAVAVLFGISLVLLPFLLPTLPLPEWLATRKTSGYLLLETLLLLLLLLVGCLYDGGDWFLMAAVSVIFGLSFIILPILLKQLPLPEGPAQCKTSIFLVTETLLLLLLLLVGCLYDGGDWFLMAAVSVIFGLGFVILPVLLKQLPLPESLRHHKCLLYFIIQTLLLVLLLFTADLYLGAGVFLSVSLPTAIACLLLPWGIMLAVRYLPVSSWFRASISILWTDLWFWLAPYALNLILEKHYGPGTYSSGLWVSFNFSLWGGAQTTANVNAIIMLALAALSIILFAVGIIRRKSR